MRVRTAITEHLVSIDSAEVEIKMAGEVVIRLGFFQISEIHFVRLLGLHQRTQEKSKHWMAYTEK